MIKKPAEMINETNKFRVLIAGYPGIGKTTLGLSAPKPLLIDVDFGINRVMASARKDYIQPNTYDEFISPLPLLLVCIASSLPNKALPLTSTKLITTVGV